MPADQPNDRDESEALSIFNERIMPIFRSPNPSSCVQCHLSSVDLKNYILPSHERTFASLRDQGLIDLENPKSSKILELIDMGSKDADGYAKRIHSELRKAEYEAFAAWITECCKDDRLRSLPAVDKDQFAGPLHPDEVIRHARKSRVLDSFVRNVWSQRMRCFPCHTPHEIRPNQTKAKDSFEKWQDQYGDQMLIFHETPEATLRYLVKASQKSKEGTLPLLNLKQPGKSLFVLKPMSKIPPKVGNQRVPTYSEPIYHMGGLKIHKDDHSHKAFLSWIEDYANIANGKYVAVDDLPIDNWFPTQRILRIRELPESLPVGTTIQMVVHPRDGDRPEWREAPIAFTQGTITPKRIANGALIMLAPTEKQVFDKWKVQHNRLPPGDYLIKIYADTEKKLESHPTAFLPESDLVGQVEHKNAKWQVGFPKAEWISGKVIGRED